jgi:hypothetical protein
MIENYLGHERYSKERNDIERRYKYEQSLLLPREQWRPMDSAPNMAIKQLVEFRAQLENGEERVVHWAQDFSGEYQPPFCGWFDREHNEVKPIRWRPL